MTHPRITKYSPEARSSSIAEQNLLLFATLTPWQGAGIHFRYRQSHHSSGHILLRRQQHPDPRGDDHERITRARQAAEALFTSKPPVTRPSVPEAASADPPQRKPRVLRIIAPPAIRPEQVKISVSSPDPQTKPTIPRSYFPRIRTWLKYGMTISQVAEIYGAEIGEIEQMLDKT
jgi:hypothetical protein